MRQYLDLLKRILSYGDRQFNERTGELMILSAGDQSVYDLREGFPNCTTKPSVPIRWVAEELFWMLRGERHAKTLYDKGVDIWNKNAFQHYLKHKGLEKEIPKHSRKWNEEFDKYQERMKLDSDFDINDSDLGPVYGWQWRHWTKKNGEEVDQIKKIIDGIKRSPGSRYHMMSAWNVGELEEMALGPCHCLAQFTVSENRNLDLNMFQRSCDVYLGVPFNIASYSLLNHLVAMETGLIPRKFIHSYGNVHIYGGVFPRSEFLNDDDSFSELQQKVRHAKVEEDYMGIREWYEKNAPAESAGNERKDHVPFVLEQLSKTPKAFPTIEISKMPFFEVINMPAKEIIKLSNYEPIKWDSRAVMAV